MEMRRRSTAWRSLDALLESGNLGNLPDGELLDCFRSRPDATGQEAFRILVERHGAMVLGLCRCLVGDVHEAEDAFQATFLVLVRRADSIRNRETIGPWLHGVAAKVARRARQRSAERRRRELPAEAGIETATVHPVEAPETRRAIEEEIGRLPASLRAPLLLCCLEGMSYDVAASRLGLSESTLRGRLHRARKQLESRLKRRGVLPAIVTRWLEPGGSMPHELPSTLVQSTTDLAARWSALDALIGPVGAIPESITFLAQGVIQAMSYQSIKIFGLVTVLSAGVIAGLVVAQPERGGQDGTSAKPQAGSAVPKAEGRVAIPASPAQPVDLAWKTQQIFDKLNETIDLKLPGEIVQLDTFLKAVKKATTDARFSGIPIYVDPVGLQQPGVKLNVQVAVIARGKLGYVIRETLRQVKLSFLVKDGFLMISSGEAIQEQRMEELDQKVDRLLGAMERLERKIDAHR